MLFVLPKESLLEILFKQDKNIYDKLKRLFNTNGKEIEEYYPNHICLDMINKEFMWQSKIFLKDPKNKKYKAIIENEIAFEKRYFKLLSPCLDAALSEPIQLRRSYGWPYPPKPTRLRSVIV